MSQIQSPPERWVGVHEVAYHLNCKPQRVYDLISQRGMSRMPFRKDGRRLLFRLSEIDRWLDLRTEGQI